MLELLWSVYFYGSPIGFIFAIVVMLKLKHQDYPYAVVLITFFGWPIMLLYVVCGLFTQDRS